LGLLISFRDHNDPKNPIVGVEPGECLDDVYQLATFTLSDTTAEATI
jgi:hypothetical protein